MSFSQIQTFGEDNNATSSQGQHDAALVAGDLSAASTLKTSAKTRIFSTFSQLKNVIRASPAPADTTSTSPLNFPVDIPISRQPFKTWSGEIDESAVWTCLARTPSDIEHVANWAKDNGFTVRPSGMKHNWSPLTLPYNSPCPSNVVLMNTTQHLKEVISIEKSTTPGTPSKITVQPGITMEDLLTRLEQEDLGMTAAPAPGDLSLGG